MGGRDHSVECEECGYQRGGLNDLACECDQPSLGEWIAREMLERLGKNIAIGAALCRAFALGNANGWDEAAMSEGYLTASSWVHGCGRDAP